MLENGLCKGHPNTEAWFYPPAFDYAISVCEQCPLKAACLESAVTNKMAYGVWGATTPRERGYKHSEDGVSDYELL